MPGDLSDAFAHGVALAYPQVIIAVQFIHQSNPTTFE